MPSFRVHLLGGIGIYILGVFFLVTSSIPLVTKIEWLLCALAGSLFPDVDIKSKGQKFFYLILLVLSVFFFIKEQVSALMGCMLLAGIPLVVKHRGIFHRLWFITLLVFIFLISMHILKPVYMRIALYDSYFFLLGAISHLVLDKGFRGLFKL